MGLFFLFTSCAEMAYKKASKANDIESYRKFVKKYPNSEYTRQVKNIIEDLYWRRISIQDTISVYNLYLQKYPVGKYTDNAEARIEELTWKGSKSIQDYQAYLKKYPMGRYVKDAEAKVEDIIYNKSESIQDYQAYLEKYPKGKYVKQVKAKIEDIIWNASKESGEIKAYQSYLAKYAHGKYTGIAKDKIEKLFWEQTVDKDTIEAYQEYVAEYRGGKFIQEANEYIKIASAYNKAGNSLQRLKQIMKEYPGTGFAKKASIRIEELNIAEINENGVGNRFVLKDIVPWDKGYQGGITIMDQENDSYMIASGYYNDSIGFSFNPFAGLSSNVKLQPSYPLKAGSVWRFVGQHIAFNGYVFSGEDKIESPLTFILLADKGFVHLRGNGSVKMKNGIVKKLMDLE